MRVCFYTLGCKVNLNETGALEQMFRSAGFTIVPEGEEADVFVVNSCTVTNFGDQKSRKWLRRAKRENPGAVTVLTGCYPQAFPEEAAQFMEADLVCGNGDRKAILDNVLKLLDGHERIVAIAPHAKGERFEELPVERFETHTRAFIKVEDGCNRQCAYCVIPRARGPVRSRAESSILAELRQLAAAGYREVVLSAISLPSYGLDTGTNLVELVEKCAQVEGIERIRLGSLDPDMLTPEFITRLAAVDKLCPQFHLSLQSGCTATLRRMRRVYSAEQYAQVVDQIRAAYEYAAAHHAGQNRKDGSPFITHPLAVAQIVAEELHLDSESIEAALLHDTIEDTDATHEEISKLFSPTVADLVEGVSKLTRIQYATKEDEQMENLRKMLIAMSKDIPVSYTHLTLPTIA